MSTPTLTVTINGKSATVEVGATKTAQDYAQAFITALGPEFPGYTFNMSPGGNIVVVAPTGQPLNITATGTDWSPVVSVRSNKADESPPVVVVVNSGVAEQTYRVSLNGQAFEYTTGTSENPETAYVETVAEDLRAKIAAAGYIVQRFANVLVIRAANGQPVSFAATDTWNNEAIKAYRGRVGNQSELPPWLDIDTVLAVGDVKDGGYYVKYTYRQQQKDGTFTEMKPSSVPHSGWVAFESSATGVYEETYLPGSRTTFFPASMPHVLVRNADGSFTFKEADWDMRRVGDEKSVPAPSFDGKQIRDVFFFRNRLGVLTEDSVVFSKSGRFFDFWPTTAKEVLDTDPVDVTIGSTQVASLRHVVPFNNNVLVVGDNQQFVLTAQGALTPATVAVQPSTSFDVSPTARPLAIGPSLYFTADNNSYESVWEYYVQQDSISNTAQELTQHVPRYIPKGVYQLAGSPSDNIVVALSKGERRMLHIYQYLWAGDQRTQSSWGRWTFAGQVVNIGFMGSKLYLAMQYATDGLCLEVIDLQEPVDTILIDRKGHANWQTYTMVYEFSPVFLQAKDGNFIGGKTKIRTISVNHSGLYTLDVAVYQAGRNAIMRSFPDNARATVFREDGTEGVLRAGVGGDARETRVALINSGSGQTTIRSVEFEMANNIRSQRV